MGLVTDVFEETFLSVNSALNVFVNQFSTNIITEIAPTLKNEILDRVPDQLGLAKVVFRPDSGDPVKIICGDIEIKDITKFEQDFLKFMKVSYPEIGKTIREKKAMDKDTEAALKKAINEFKDIFGSDKNGNHGEVR